MAGTLGSTKILTSEGWKSVESLVGKTFKIRYGNLSEVTIPGGFVLLGKKFVYQICLDDFNPAKKFFVTSDTKIAVFDYSQLRDPSEGPSGDPAAWRTPREIKNGTCLTTHIYDEGFVEFGCEIDGDSGTPMTESVDSVTAVPCLADGGKEVDVYWVDLGKLVPDQEIHFVVRYCNAVLHVSGS